MNTKFLTAITTAGLILTCSAARAHDGHGDAPKQEGQTYYGKSALLGDGSVRTYVVVSKEKSEAIKRRPPTEMGIEIPAAVMNSLPAEGKALVIDFPIQAKDTPMQYMMFDWNPQGHEPAGIYDKPHFDFHFYMQDLDDVMDINPGPCAGLDCDDYAKARRPVPAAFTPQGYIDVGSVVPYMGNHLIDPTSPEFNGQAFTRTWLYGAYDGEITFYEPMITKATLTGDPNHCEALKLPREYAESGYYPTKYCTAYDSTASLYRVSIQGFEYRSVPRVRERGR
jgi:hypothetical protein